MGLFSHIINSKQQQSIGLLAKAESLSLSPANDSDFFTWATESGYKCAGLFSSIHHIFVLKNAIGLDAETIASSVSSFDFWKGTLAQENSWNTFSIKDSSITPFYQFLSSDICPSITRLHFLPLTKGEEKIIFMIAETGKELVLPDPSNFSFRNKLFSFVNEQNNLNSETKFENTFASGFALSDAYLMILSVKIGIDTSIKSIELPEKDIRNQVIKTIFTEIADTISKLFQTPDSMHEGINGEIKIVMFTKEEPDEKLLQFHLMQTLKPILGNSGASSILLLSAGTSHTAKGATAFILQG